MYYNRFRYYDCNDGRYISQDPIGLNSGEFGFYNYVEDSNTWVDIFGLQSSTYKPDLPDYDGKTTHGVLVYEENGVVKVKKFKSGGETPYSNYASANHVEGKAALFMRENNITEGTCGYCVTMTSTLLETDSKLTVVPPKNAKPKNTRSTAETKTFIGNDKTPKKPK